MSQSRMVILNYHGIEASPNQYVWEPGERPYVLPLIDFKQQLELIELKSFQTLNLSELDLWLDGRQSPDKKIVLTFDDGHISHYDHVMPALKAKNMKGVFLVSAGLVGQKQLMNWQQLRELVSQGFEVGSHGLLHQPLSSVTHHELWKELQKSKAILEDKLGVKVSSFSVPRGYYQDRIREVALEVGYRFVFTSRFDVNFRATADRFRLNRIAIKKKIRAETFLKYVKGDLGFKRTVEQLKETARRYIDPSIYDSLSKFKRTVLEGEKELK